MKYQNVCIEALGYTLPDEVVTSDELEARLEPLYSRLRLPEGRLELMTGIRERRILARRHAAQRDERRQRASGHCRRRASTAAQIGALVHGSVCRDYLEPATACRVHHGSGCAEQCLIYDVSNACLGMLNGIVQVANMIELGQIRAGLVVGTESSRPLVETTIAALNADMSLTREQVKLADRLAHDRLGQRRGAAGTIERSAAPATACWPPRRGPTPPAHGLCHSGRDEAVAGGMQPLMETDSRTADARRHRGRRRHVRRVPGRDRLVARRHRQDVLPPGRRGASQADARIAGPRSGNRLCHVRNAWATPARSPCRSRWPWASKQGHLQAQRARRAAWASARASTP